MRLVFAGTPQAAVPSLRALLASPRHEVIAVITRPDARAGRGRRLLRSAVGTVADENDIEVRSPGKLSEPGFLAWLAEQRPDCCPVVAYGALVPRLALDIPSHGWVNLHFSLLPAWRGAAPVQAAIRHGDEITGASTFALEEGMDTGPVYGTVTEPIAPTDTAGTVGERLATAGATLLTCTLDGIADGALQAVPQPEDGVSFAPKVSAADAHIDFEVPAFAVERQVRSVTPEPGAWVRFRELRLGIGPVEITEARDMAAGQLQAGKREVLVGTTTTAVRLGEVRPAGRSPMPAPDWARGVRPQAGERML